MWRFFDKPKGYFDRYALPDRRIIFFTLSAFTAAHCLTDVRGQIFPKEFFEVAVGKYYREIDNIEDNEAQFSEVNLSKTIAAILLMQKFRFTKCLLRNNTKVIFKIM